MPSDARASTESLRPSEAGDGSAEGEDSAPLLGSDRGAERDEGTHTQSVATPAGGWRSLAPLARIAAPLLLFMIGQLAVFIPLQQLIIQWICDDVLPPDEGTDTTDADRCNAPIVQSTAAAWMAVFSLCTAVPALFIVPLYAHLSDTVWGRKRLMVLPILGSILADGALLVLAARIDALGHRALYILASISILSTFFGGAGVIGVAVMGYLADITDVADRTVVMGRLQAVFMSSLLVGPLLGGVLVKVTSSNLAPFWFGIAADTLVLLYILAFLHDPPRRKPAAARSEPDTPRKKAPATAQGEAGATSEEHTPLTQAGGDAGDDTDAAEVEDEPASATAAPAAAAPSPAPATGTAKAALASLAAAASGDNFPRTVLVLVVFLATCGAIGSRQVMVLYTRLEFGWQAYEAGVFLSVYALGQVVSLSVVLPFVVRVMKRAFGLAHEVWMIRLSLAGDVALFCLFAAAKQGWQFLLAGVILSPLCSALGGPAIRSLLSSLTAPDQQARVFSALHVVEGVATIVAQTTFAVLYSHLVETRRERLVMLAIAAVMALAFCVAWLISSEQVERRKTTVIAGEEAEAEAAAARVAGIVPDGLAGIGAGRPSLVGDEEVAV